MERNIKIILIFITFALILVSFGSKARAASLSLAPSTGTFPIEDTFDATIYLNTEGKSINAVKAVLRFPPDKLQVVSPATGNSIITLWATQPKFNNQTGTIELQGGVEGGINTSRGLVTTLTFRAKRIGTATVKFTEDSQVLLNDGSGTEVLGQVSNGIYTLTLPPPEGPVVVSDTHADQSRWYPNPSAVLRWESEEGGVEGYSYILNEKPVDTPDDISEGTDKEVVYRNLADGRHYFHIKALREGIWGGVTNFAVNVDATSPAEFPIEILPSATTSKRNPIIQFLTTDNASGIDHYELKIVPLQKTENIQEIGEESFFIEVSSPYVAPHLDMGSYDVIVRAYDRAGNFSEVIERLKIGNFFFQIVRGKGVMIANRFTISWFWLFVIIIAALITLAYTARKLKKRHDELERQVVTREKLSPSVKKQLEDLKEYQNKYGKLKAAVVLAIASTCLFFGLNASVQAGNEPGPPIVTTVTESISNEEIFYVGGKTEAANTEVTIFLQNIETGETSSHTITSDKRADWFYRHDAFLPRGEYLLWVQAKIGEIESPPSPQVQVSVSQTAIQFGASKISLETVYVFAIAILLITVIVLILYIILHGFKLRKKGKMMAKEIQEAEDAVRHGFDALRRDIRAELGIVKKAKRGRSLSKEEKEKEKQLMDDLDAIERNIEKEVFDIERLRQ